MLVSTSRNFIFIHIAKNGGTSLREILSPYCVQGRNRTPWNELLSRLPFRQPPESIAYPPHRGARWARRKLGAEFFDNAFTFAFVRNPYDRAVSRFEYIRQTPGHHQHKRFQKFGFEHFISDERMRNLVFTRTQLSAISDRSGRIIVSKVYRVEDFQDSVNDICARLDIPVPGDSPKMNRSRRRGYRAYFTPELKTVFDNLYRADLDTFSYEF